MDYKLELITNPHKLRKSKFKFNKLNKSRTEIIIETLYKELDLKEKNIDNLLLEDIVNLTLDINRELDIDNKLKDNRKSEILLNNILNKTVEKIEKPKNNDISNIKKISITEKKK